ncbi:hypothetical protein Q5P01_019235 [Channa striata]|uniref:SMB domain-containing protein n=1 Tax=Channa striata TaxID=64152 RepID=A0AA88M0P4_CHASR|nr:hypothetical protein Q5P01_019235 [Channa striata]
MKAAGILLGIVLLLDATFAAEESCVGRCGSFERQSKCQCDSMCVYYGSCCPDFDTICPKKIRGDTFETEGGTEGPAFYSTTLEPTVSVTASNLQNSSHGLTPPVDTDTEPCSGRPFDAFLQLKNGSIYAFRGEYFFELDDKSVLPGYPKLIQDVWGIPGPIDAAFTRINCQGKSYIFKGKQYWRFEGDVLDEGYPRDISTGFENIPGDVDAAFALPASSHSSKEKAYFFKANRYYQYEFKLQPSHEECVRMTQSSPSMLFTQYTDLFCDQTWEDFFTELFGGTFSSHDVGPRFISGDWLGISYPVDAAMVGRVYVTPKSTPSSPSPMKRWNKRRKRPSKKRRHRKRQKRQILYDDLWGFDYGLEDSDFFDISHESTTQQSTPVQNVYFFKRDKYYKLDLQTRTVSSAKPPYPRSIARYWLGCKYEAPPDASGAEKR